MSRTERTSAWERLLGEPIAAVAPARIIDGSAYRGTVVLTDSRLVVIRSAPGRPPRTPRGLTRRLRIQFRRSNLTELVPAQQWPGGYDIRYYDGIDEGEERKFRIKPGPDDNGLVARLEEDLSGSA